MVGGERASGEQPHTVDGARLVTGVGALVYLAIALLVASAPGGSLQWLAAYLLLSVLAFSVAWLAVRRRGVDILRRPSLRLVLILGLLMVSNPIAQMIATERAHPSIGMAVVIPALAALVHHRRAAIALVLIANVAWVGLLAWYGVTETAGYTRFFGELLVIDSVAALLHVTRNRTVLRLDTARRDVAQLAVTDGLTGLANQRHVHDVGSLLYGRTRRTGEAFAVLFVDVDDLKGVNDRDGHAAGDRLIQGVAEVLARCVREHDLVGRVGGDEFVVVCTGLDDDGLRSLKQRVVGELARRGQAASIGVATARGADDERFQDVMARADHAMYAEKSARRPAAANPSGSAPTL